MANEYKKPRLILDNWEVTGKDLRIIYNFFWKHFKKSEIEIHLETLGSESGIYNDFEEFKREIEKIIKKEIHITSILFSAGHTLRDGIEKRKYVWIEIRFDANDAEFYLYAKDKDGSLEFWADRTYKELEKLVSLFENKRHKKQRVVLKYFKESKGKRYNLYKTPITELAFIKGDGWYRDPVELFSIFLGVTGITVSTVSLILQIILNWN